MDRPLHTVRAAQQLAPLMRAFRRQAGLSQAQLAEQLGISRQAVGALERDPASASFERLMRIWAVLGLEVSLQQRSPQENLSSLEW
ncbi:transcriptional regulator [Stenotrophomonas maltophilia]|nr:transcriptional regulator [Stenotrophomonas maltophilia]ALA88785.1 transcriptional regulator [Stenotrophomonas maltophilia]